MWKGGPTDDPILSSLRHESNAGRSTIDSGSNLLLSSAGNGNAWASQPESHRKHVLAIIAALLIGLIVRGIIGFSFPIAADYTNLTGSVTLSNQFQGVPNLIMFNSTLYGNLTSTVLSDHSYVINLPIGDTYNVSIQWFNATATPSQMFGRCSPSQSTFTSDNQNATQDFSC